ncbi:MAG TPA: nucleotidyltransferase domain-containing protein [Candidatus Dormibacteraeota bacterium]|nr:nucleotidyltransferase domain-containing protein [Candidatus Dormibacteraeota bacterium]
MDLTAPYAIICPSLDGPVLEVLAHTTRPLSGREVARLSRRGSERGVRLTLHRLADQGLVTTLEAGRGSFYTLNRDHLGAPLVEQLMHLRSDLIVRLRETIEGWLIKPSHVSLFGSAARGDGNALSDVDLLLVRRSEVASEDSGWRDQLNGLAADVHRWTGNNASLVEVSSDQLLATLRREEAIVSSLRSDAIVLFGSEFYALASQLNGGPL